MGNSFKPWLMVQFVEDPGMVVKVTKRIRGGYMNRWLIRVEMLVPNPHPRIVDGRLHAHPLAMAAVKAELAASERLPCL